MSDAEIGRSYLEDAVLILGKQRRLAEKALAQIDDAAFFSTLDAEANSCALLVKHVAGNQRSRWRDFLTTDGEKPDRRRDTEFERHEEDDRDALMARWQEGWELTLSTIGGLAPEDLLRRVEIRGEPHTVLQAIQRQVVHYAQHVGQIVLLAKHAAGDRWRSLSIPRGESARFEVARDGAVDRPDGSRS